MMRKWFGCDCAWSQVCVMKLLIDSCNFETCMIITFHAGVHNLIIHFFFLCQIKHCNFLKITTLGSSMFHSREKNLKNWTTLRRGKKGGTRHGGIGCSNWCGLFPCRLCTNRIYLVLSHWFQSWCIHCVYRCVAWCATVKHVYVCVCECYHIGNAKMTMQC